MKTREKWDIYPVVEGGVELWIGCFALCDDESLSTISETLSIGKFRTEEEAVNFVNAARERNAKHAIQPPAKKRKR